MIKVTTDAGVTRLTINRPERKNALDSKTMKALLDALLEVETSPECRVVVICGEGGSFSAGRDLKEAGSMDLEPALAQHDSWSDVFTVLQRLRVPSVAVVSGFAVAGGFTLAMGCDFAIAERQAKFGALEMANGFPAAVCTPLLAHKAPHRIGLELAMFGELVSAQRLYEAGLLNVVADGGEALDTAVARFVNRILELSPGAVRQTLETFRAARTMALPEAMTLGRHLNQLLDASGRFKSGAEAFAGGQHKN
jgi:enoyl-CoA hydratase/carnithine racemase